MGSKSQFFNILKKMEENLYQLDMMLMKHYAPNPLLVKNDGTLLQQ